MTIRIVNSVHVEFISRNTDQKEDLAAFIFEHLETEIKASFESLHEIKYDKKNVWEEWTTQKKYNDYIYRYLGSTLIWTYSELKQLFELESIKMNANRPEVLLKTYPFDIFSKTNLEKNQTTMFESVVMRHVALKSYNRATVTKLIIEIKERYLIFNSQNITNVRTPDLAPTNSIKLY